MTIPENKFPAVYIDKVVQQDGCVLLDVTVGSRGEMYLSDIFTLYKNASVNLAGRERAFKVDVQVNIAIKSLMRTSMMETNTLLAEDVARLQVTGSPDDLEELAVGMWLVVYPSSQ